MAAAYDTYDYLSYWEGREYEHASEVIAVKSLLSKIAKIDTILDIGAGFGRLTSSYLFRARRIILSDPSSGILKIAREKLPDEANVKFVHSGIENLPQKVRAHSVDLAIMVRVLHHLENPLKAFGIINKLLAPNGYFILEFANKRHFKALISELVGGNFTFLLDIAPKDIRSPKNVKKRTLPFINYHPDVITNLLDKSGFEIIQTLSVSNIRSPFLKKVFSTATLIAFEKYIQKPLSYLNFGPSIFVLARKRD